MHRRADRPSNGKALDAEGKALRSHDEQVQRSDRCVVAGAPHTQQQEVKRSSCRTTIAMEDGSCKDWCGG